MADDIELSDYPDTPDDLVDSDQEINQWAILAALLLGILILVLVITLLIFRLEQPIFLPAATATREMTATLTSTVTLTPSATLTPTPSNTLSPTPRPTSTPTLTYTPTRTPPFTLTPASLDTSPEFYYLAEWSPQAANSAIELLEFLPETLGDTQRGVNDKIYYGSFYAPAVAQGDALLHFVDLPDLPWRFGSAYNLGLAGEPSTVDEYGIILESAINQQVTDIQELPAWFRTIQPNLVLNLLDLQPTLAGDPSYLVEIYGPGGAYLWMVEGENETRVYPLTNQMNYPYPHISQPLVGDITGDGVQEVIIWNSAVSGSDTFNLPQVFDLSTGEPNRLNFEPWEDFYLGIESSITWSVGRESADQGKLIFSAEVFPPCPGNVRRVYQVLDNQLILEAVNFSVFPPASPELLGFCQILVDHAANFWGPEAAIPIMETVLPLWPPPVYADGTLPPFDAVDEWRYRLGIYHILASQIVSGVKYLEDLVTNPTVPLSRWVEPARSFLETYQEPEDIYRACLNAPYCNPREALVEAIEQLPAGATDNPIPSLQSIGVRVRSTAAYDFDLDGESERWFILQHTSEIKPEYWILTENVTNPTAVFVDVVQANIIPLSQFETDDGPPVVWLGNQKSFRFHRKPDTAQPYLEAQPLVYFYDRLTKTKTDEAAQILFYGGDPADAFDLLQNLVNKRQATCITNPEICARFYTIRAIAAEMIGDPSTAARSFVEVWIQAPQSFLTTFARLKLVRDPSAPTLTPTPSRTPTITNTPTVSRTPTITVNPSITRVPSKTATITLTPDPNATRTPTPSQTPSPTPTLSPTP
jgi:hypothetical protein